MKIFPGVVANAGVDLDIHPDEILALLGENGAGKSTLMSVVAGLYRPDAGTIQFDGRSVELRSPRDAINRGVGMVHQHFRLVNAFTVTENILLGWHEPRFLLERSAGDEQVARLAEEYGLAVDPPARVGELSVGERQRVEILKMLYRRARVLILDEPTAVLTPPEVEQLFAGMRRMKKDGRGVVFISHKIDEVFAVADRIVILRAGRVVEETRPAQTTPRELARAMVGRGVTVAEGNHVAGRRQSALSAASESRTPLLESRKLTIGADRGHVAVRGATWTLNSGEILGIAGVAGNGQRELLEAIAGIRPPLSGQLLWRGEDLASVDIRGRWTRGIAYIPEERLGEGLIPPFSVAENTVLRDYYRPPVSRGMAIQWKNVRERAAAIVDAFQVRTPSVDTPVRHLSGGNQQRLLVGRETFRRPDLLLAMHPTRGLDIQATAYMHRTLRDLRESGTSVILVSESLDEILSLADRILVMHRGATLGPFEATGITREEIGLLMARGQAH